MDQVLKQTGAEQIVNLVKQADFTNTIFSDKSVLRVVPAKQKVVRNLIRTPRVGLTLKKIDQERPKYLMRDYRYLNIPEQMSKGKPYIILALHRAGKSSQEISDITKTKAPVVKRYVELYEGNKHAPEYFLGKTLNTEAMCEIYAACRK